MKQLRLSLALALLGAGTVSAFYYTAPPAPEPLSPAQNFTASPDSITEISVPHAPSLLVQRHENDSSSTPLRLGSLRMHVRTLGNLAQTTMEMTFYNDMDRELEGQFVFPLGEGQAVSGYALDIMGSMRPGVVVEKNEGRKIFESITRRRIDPGLLEWTKGNHFKTRIYPIPARGSRTISVTVEQELISGQNAFHYSMPMVFKEPIDRFALKVEVIDQPHEPVLDQVPGSLRLKNQNNTWTADFDTVNYAANEPLRFSIPKKNMQRVFFSAAENNGNESYFYYTLDPQQPEKAKTLPGRICILWDASGSGLHRNTQQEIALLTAYLQKTGSSEVKVVSFSNEVLAEKDFAAMSRQSPALENYLASLSFDGGTQMGALDLKKYSCDEFILCSDGISTFGRHDLVTGTTPVIAISSSQQADHQHLQRIARLTGGRYINLLNTPHAQALQQMTTQPYRFLYARTTAGTVKEIYPSMATDINRSFSISGKLTGNAATVELCFGYGNTPEQTYRINIERNGAQHNEMVSRAWAQKKIQALLADTGQNKNAIVEIAKTHSIVTPYTSLLVLDRLEDYVLYKIVPPEKSMRDAYDAKREAQIRSEKEKAIARAEEKKTHLEDVVSSFRGRISWWEKDFTAELEQKQKTKSGETRSEADMSVLTDSVATGSYTGTSVNGNATTLTFGLSASGTTYTWNNGNAATVNNEASIALKAFDPQTPYIKALKNAPASEQYAVYLRQRKMYTDSPSFYLDVSDFFFRKGDTRKAITILSNLAEFFPENHQVLRVMSHRLQQAKQHELAILGFQEVLSLREEEPQSYRDLGLAYAEIKKYQEAVDMLCKVVNRIWDDRFPNVELMVAGEINTIIDRCPYALRLDSLDKRLIKHMPVDVRVVINWDNDNCDMDLWVTGPDGEKCFYGNTLTASGGSLSSDFTGGYGPEEFMIKKAINGKYLVQVNYYGSSQTIPTGPTTVQAELYTHYGTPLQKKRTITVRLDDSKQVFDIGELLFAAK